MFDHNSVSRPTRAIEVVYCYFESDKDEELRDELEKHLTTLKREGLITSWCKKEIQAGGEEESQINKHIDTASLILLLISSDFIASPTCYDQQFDRAIKRYENAEAHVMPVLLRPVDWHDSRFGDMRPLPTNGVPVTSWSNSDEAFQDITKEIRNVVKEFWLRDEQRINESYNQLRKELATQEWRKANDTTKSILFRIALKEEIGNLSAEDMKIVPFQDIYAINKLWSEYSNGHFGFSIQKYLLQQSDYESFIKQIGWNVDDSWLEYENLQFNLNSPEGHLPYSGVHFWQAVPSFPSEPPNINYYKLPRTRNEFYYRYPVNYYQRQKTFQEQFKPRNQLDLDLSNSEFKREIEQISNSSFITPSPVINNRSGGGAGGALMGLGILARAAFPWALTVAAVGTLAWLGYEGYKKYKHHEKENEIKEKIESLLSRLN
ncbi:hypothetical protein BCD67_07535 [Oscillatoriales cyanobacterium USR001]|nr:hypothetical protein BCD67_07535 [Oscillatoriales cyanobacterium USR001]